MLTQKEKILIIIVLALSAVGLLIGLWRLATWDYCPIYYHVTCLPK